MKHHVNQTLKILDDLREAFAEIDRLRYGIQQAVSRLAPHAESASVGGNHRRRAVGTRGR